MKRTRSTAHRLRSFLIATVLAAAPCWQAGAATNSATWIGGGGNTLWSNPLNWSGGVVPNNVTSPVASATFWDVTFNTGTEITIPLVSGFAVNSLLWSGGSLKGTPGDGFKSLGVTTGIFSSGNITLSNLEAFSLATGATWNNAGNLTVSDVTFRSNSTSGQGVFNNQVGAQFIKTGSEDVVVNDLTAFNNLGQLTVQEGALQISPTTGTAASGSVMKVDAGASLNLIGTIHFEHGSTFTNAGDLTFGDGSTAQFSRGANVTFDGTFTSTGLTNVRVNNTITFNNTANLAKLNVTNGGTISGSGVVTISESLDGGNGTMSGSGTTVIAGSATALLTGNSSINGRTFVNNGKTTLTGTSLTIQLGAEFQNNGEFTISGASDVVGNGAQFPGSLVKNSSSGKLIKTGVGTLSEISATLVSDGAIEVREGTLSMISPGAQGGGLAPTESFFRAGSMVTVSSGATFEINGASSSPSTYKFQTGSTLASQGAVIFRAGTVTMDGAFTNTGDTSILGGTVSLNSNVTLPSLTMSGGTLGGSGLTTITGNVAWSGGTMAGTGRTVLAATATSVLGNGGAPQINGRQVINEGAATLLSGGLSITNGGGFVNKGAFDLRSGADVTGGTTTGSLLSNEGTLTKSSIGTQSDISVAFVNKGTVLVNEGTLNLTTTHQNRGTVYLGGGALQASASTGFVNTRTGRLAGAGTITGGIANSGILAPGDLANGTAGIGTFDVNGRFSLTATSVLKLDLAGVTPGTQYDGFNIALSGGVTTITLAGVLDVGFLSGFQNAVAGANTFTILQATGGTFQGTFANLSGGRVAVDGFGSFAVTISSNAVTLGNYQPALGGFAAVPEPQTWALLGLGLAAVVMLRRRARTRRLVVAGLLGAATLGVSQAQTETILINNGNWNDAANWSNGAPINGGGTTWNAILPAPFSGGGGTSTATLNIPITVTGLNFGGGAITGGQMLTVLGDALISGGILQSSAILRTEGTTILQGGNLNFADTASLRNVGTFNMVNGAGFNRGTIQNDGIINKLGLGTEGSFINGGTLINASTVNVKEGVLTLETGQTIGSSAKFDVSAGAELKLVNKYLFDTGSTISGAGTVNIDLRQQIADPTVTINGAYTASGHLKIGANVNLNTNATVTDVTLIGATFQRPSDLRGSGNVSVTKSFTMQKGSGLSGDFGTTFTVESAATGVIEGGAIGGARTFINKGDITVTSTEAPGQFAEPFTISTDATLDNDGTLTFVNGAKSYGVGSIRNDGNLVSTGIGTIGRIENPLLNAGTLTVASGTLELAGGSQTLGSAAKYEVAAGAKLALSNTHTFGAGSQVTGAGVVEITSGTTTVNGSYLATGELRATGGTLTVNSVVNTAKVAITGGTFQGGGNVVVNEEFTFSGGTLGGNANTTFTVGQNGVANLTGGTLAGSRRLVNQGTMSLLASTVTLGATNTLRNEGTFRATGNSAISGTGTIENTGTFLKLTDLSTTTIAGAFTNTGTLDVQAGRLAFGSSLALTNTSNVAMTLDGQLLDDGIIQVGGLLTYDGTLTISLAGGLAPLPGETFLVFKKLGTVAGSFDTVTVTNPGYTATFNAVNGTVAFQTVPEPGTLLLLTVAGCLALSLRRRSSKLATQRGASHRDAQCRE